MRAVRAHLRGGAIVALLALALQLALSFGHSHPVAAPSAGIATASVVSHSQGGPDGIASDECDICATIALAGSVVHAEAPVLPVPAAFAPAPSPRRATAAVRTATFVAFNSRAPPSA